MKVRSAQDYHNEPINNEALLRAWAIVAVRQVAGVQG